MKLLQTRLCKSPKFSVQAKGDQDGDNVYLIVQHLAHINTETITIMILIFILRLLVNRKRTGRAAVTTITAATTTITTTKATYAMIVLAIVP